MTTPRLVLVSGTTGTVVPLPQLAREAVDGGVDVVQVRDRTLSAGELDAVVMDVVAAVGSARVAVNGSPEIAARHGVHLHLPERSVFDLCRSHRIPSVSNSVHTVESLDPVPSGALYVIAGHVFETTTHPDVPPIGIRGLAAITAAARPPVIAIGGITPSRVGAALSAGATGVAVMSYVNSSERPRVAARELRDALEKAMNQAPAAINVQVNGKSMVIEPGITLTAFLEQRNLHPRLVVVERNHEIVAKSAYDSVVLQEADLLEIAHFVGGG